MLTRDAQGSYVGEWYGRTVRLPSVTKVLAPLTNYGFVDPKLLARAQRYGTRVHKMIELHELGELDESSLVPPPPVPGEEPIQDLTPVLEAWKACVKLNHIEVCAVEAVVVSLKHGYAGRLDLMGFVGGVPSIIDIKTRAYHPVTDRLQSAAYLAAWSECHPTEPAIRRYFCLLNMDGTHELIRMEGDSDFHYFRSALALHYWQERNK